MDLKLAGRSALVTGASSGIGQGIAVALAAEGVRVGISARSTAALAETSALIVAAGGPQPHLFAADLTRPADVEKLAGEARTGLPELDILVSNAGGSRPLLPSDGEAPWEEAFELNFTSARRLTTLLLDPIKATGQGRILVVTGAWTTRAINAATPAKAALTSWARTLSLELAPHGVTVNCLAPGRIDSRQVRERLHPTQESRDRYIADNIPLGRFGTPEEFGFLAAASPRRVPAMSAAP